MLCWNNKSKTIPILNMTMDEDGLGATLDLAITLANEKDYSVSLNESQVTFTASVGEVATLALKTASAQQNVETPIEFALFDAKGIEIPFDQLVIRNAKSDN